MKATTGNSAGTAVESLSFEVGGETSKDQPAVLSCGGIFFPRRKVPTELRSWRQLVNLPGDASSAKIFEIAAPDPKEDLQSILLRDSLN